MLYEDIRPDLGKTPAECTYLMHRPGTDIHLENWGSGKLGKITRRGQYDKR